MNERIAPHIRTDARAWQMTLDVLIAGLVLCIFSAVNYGPRPLLLVLFSMLSAIAAEAPLTDDCSAVERLGKEVYLTPGWRENIKITTPEDLSVAELFLRRREVQA